MNEHQEHTMEKAERLAAELIELTNAFGSETVVAAGISKAIGSAHNTIQQGFFKTLQFVIVTHGNEQYTDLRNEASVAYCKAAGSLVKDHHLPCI
tara:strand:+ start:1423 stop:1707 length:285 start_codon:yes stop_codon:yes gene_type:complete